MKFQDYTEFYKWENRDGYLTENNIKSLDEYCEILMRRMKMVDPQEHPNEHENLRTKLLVSSFEEIWTADKKPYYDLYPSIIPTLEKLKMDFPLEDVRLPMGLKTLLIRFPEGNDIAAVFLGYQKDEPHEGTITRLVINAYMADEFYTDHDHMTITICWEPHRTGTELFEELKKSNRTAIGGKGSDFEIEVLERVFRVALGVCLIGEDPTLLEPQVLRKDLHKLNEENAQRLFDKARRRGKFGFSLGKSLDKIPHIRRPHLCWVPYGPGRTKRKLILRKGSIVHRDVVEKMPSGTLDG